jgi:hypothetical protein
MENKNRILKAGSWQYNITRKGKPIRITDYSTETLKTGRERRY